MFVIILCFSFSEHVGHHSVSLLQWTCWSSLCVSPSVNLLVTTLSLLQWTCWSSKQSINQSINVGHHSVLVISLSAYRYVLVITLHCSFSECLVCFSFSECVGHQSLFLLQWTCCTVIILCFSFSEHVGHHSVSLLQFSPEIIVMVSWT